MLWEFRLTLALIYLFSILQCLHVQTTATNEAGNLDEDPLLVAFRNRLQQLRTEKEQLKMKKEQLKAAKDMWLRSAQMFDVIELNVGGEGMMTTRETLSKVPTSILAKLVNSRWEEKLDRDFDGHIFLDFDSVLFRHLLEQLRQRRNQHATFFSPPHASSARSVRAFKLMLKKLGLHAKESSSNATIVVNAGGDRVETRQETLILSNLTHPAPGLVSKTIPKGVQDARLFIDTDPRLFQAFLTQLREQRNMKRPHIRAPSCKQIKAIDEILKDLRLNLTSDIRIKSVDTMGTSWSTPPYPARWNTTGETVASGLKSPWALVVDKDQTLYIADESDFSIVAWKVGATKGEVVAGGRGCCRRMDQLGQPSGVVIDRETDSLLISQWAVGRVSRWPRRKGADSNSTGELFIDGIDSWGLTMDSQGAVYVSDFKKHEVRRYDKGGDKSGTVVAGGHEKGEGLHQLDWPTGIFVDAQLTLYVADSSNNRVMKWPKGAKEGMIVAGGSFQGKALNQLYLPNGVWADGCGNIFVVDTGNDRVVLWEAGAKEGTVIAGVGGRGNQANQLNQPRGLFFDHHGHLYVADTRNRRIQRFSLIEK